MVQKGAASRWAAQRTRVEHESKFDAIKASKEGRPVLFTGEVWKEIAFFQLKTQNLPKLVSELNKYTLY